MNELQPAQQPTQEATATVENVPVPVDWNKVLDVVAPHFPEAFKLMTDNLTRHNRMTLSVSTVILVLIVVALTGLAAYAMALDKIDTAEKIVIALVSFLGGTALFGGTKK